MPGNELLLFLKDLLNEPLMFCAQAIRVSRVLSLQVLDGGHRIVEGHGLIVQSGGNCGTARLGFYLGSLRSYLLLLLRGRSLWLEVLGDQEVARGCSLLLLLLICYVCGLLKSTWLLDDGVGALDHV